MLRCARAIGLIMMHIDPHFVPRVGNESGSRTIYSICLIALAISQFTFNQVSNIPAWCSDPGVEMPDPLFSSGDIIQP